MFYSGEEVRNFLRFQYESVSKHIRADKCNSVILSERKDLASFTFL